MTAGYAPVYETDLFLQRSQHHPGGMTEFFIKVHSCLADAAPSAGMQVMTTVSSPDCLLIFQVIGNACQTGERDTEILCNAYQTEFFFGKIVNDHIQAVGEPVNPVGKPAAQFTIILMKNYYHQICMEQQLCCPFFVVVAAEQALDIAMSAEKRCKILHAEICSCDWKRAPEGNNIRMFHCCFLSQKADKR